MKTLRGIWKSIAFTVDPSNPDAILKENSGSFCLWQCFKLITVPTVLVLSLFGVLSLIGKISALAIDKPNWCPSYTNYSANRETCSREAYTSYFFCIDVWLFTCSLHGILSAAIILVAIFVLVVLVRAIYEIYLAWKPLEEVTIDENDAYDWMTSFPQIRFMFSSKNTDNLMHYPEADEVVDTKLYLLLNSGHVVKWGVFFSYWIVIIIVSGSLIALISYIVIIIIVGTGILSTRLIHKDIWQCKSNMTLETADITCTIIGILEIVSLLFIGLFAYYLFHCGRDCKSAIKSPEEIPLIKTKYAAEQATL